MRTVIGILFVFLLLTTGRTAWADGFLEVVHDEANTTGTFGDWASFDHYEFSIYLSNTGDEALSYTLSIPGHDDAHASNYPAGKYCDAPFLADGMTSEDDEITGNIDAGGLKQINFTFDPDMIPFLGVGQHSTKIYIEYDDHPDALEVSVPMTVNSAGIAPDNDVPIKLDISTDAEYIIRTPARGSADGISENRCQYFDNRLATTTSGEPQTRYGDDQYHSVWFAIPSPVTSDVKEVTLILRRLVAESASRAWVLSPWFLPNGKELREDNLQPVPFVNTTNMGGEVITVPITNDVDYYLSVSGPAASDEGGFAIERYEPEFVAEPVLAVTPMDTGLDQQGEWRVSLPQIERTYAIKNESGDLIDYNVTINGTAGYEFHNSTTSGTLGIGESRNITVRSNPDYIENFLAAGEHTTQVYFESFTNDNYPGRPGPGTTWRNLRTYLVNPGPPENDDPDGARALGANSGSITDDNRYAERLSAGEPLIDNHIPQYSLWYKWTPPVTAQMTLTTTKAPFPDEWYTPMAVYQRTPADRPEGSAPFAVGYADLTQVAENFCKQNAQGQCTETWSEIVFDAQKGVEYFIQLATNDASNWGQVQLNWSTSEPQSNMRAAVLPTSRAGRVGQLLTAYGALTNTAESQAQNCGISVPASTDAQFTWQTTNALNQLTGSPETGANIDAGATQNYVFGAIPNMEMHSQEISVVFMCDNDNPVPSTSGLNRFTLTALNEDTPDMVSVGATQNNDGIVTVPDPGGNAGFFSAATYNNGASGNVVAKVNDGGNMLSARYYVCQTDPSTGVCLGNLTQDETGPLGMNQFETATWAVFIYADDLIQFVPEQARVYLEFFSAVTGYKIGGTSVAICTASQPD